MTARPLRAWPLAALLALGACAEAPPAVPVEVPVLVRLGGAAAACGRPASGVGATGATVEPTDLRFYLSDLALVRPDGQVVPVTLDVSEWQSARVALVDAEDGSAACAGGTPQTHTTLTGRAPAGDVAGLRVTLGVPAPENHADYTTAAAPLDVPTLFWSWQAGRMFTRIEVASGDTVFPFHLGSTGCVSASAVAPPTTDCARPNRPTVTLDGFAPGRDTLVLDLDALLAGVDLAAPEPGTPGCRSDPGDPDCAAAWPALGLDPATGTCADGCRGQTALLRAGP